jgi:hypothetical protein
MMLSTDDVSPFQGLTTSFETTFPGLHPVMCHAIGAYTNYEKESV